jgi:hypothetical protein
MHGGDGDKERFGPVLRLTALAATLLALGAVIGPRLASSGGGGSRNSSTTTASLPAGATTSSLITGTSRPEGAATTSPAVPAASPSTTVPIVVPTGEGLDSGAVELALIGVHAGRYGAEQSGFVAGDTIGWHFQVTNTGGEYLWGVYVYLELHGRVSCTERRLDVGESADCWAETTAVAGGNDAGAWVTAWTDTRMVTDRVTSRVTAVAD